MYTEVDVISNDFFSLVLSFLCKNQTKKAQCKKSRPVKAGIRKRRYKSLKHPRCISFFARNAILQREIPVTKLPYSFKIRFVH